MVGVAFCCLCCAFCFMFYIYRDYQTQKLELLLAIERNKKFGEMPELWKNGQFATADPYQGQRGGAGSGMDVLDFYGNVRDAVNAEDQVYEGRTVLPPSNP